MVEVPVFCLHKREVVAAACKPIMEAKWGGGKGSGEESGPWFEAWDGALSELGDSKKSPASPTVPSAECPLRVATVALVIAGAACAICGTINNAMRVAPGISMQSAMFAGFGVCRRANQKKKRFFWTSRLRLFPVCCSFFSIPARIRGAFSGRGRSADQKFPLS